MTNKKKVFLVQSLVTLATHNVIYIQETTPNFLRSACIFIHVHIKYPLYVHTQ